MRAQIAPRPSQPSLTARVPWTAVFAFAATALASSGCVIGLSLILQRAQSGLALAAGNAAAQPIPDGALPDAMTQLCSRRAAGDP